MQNFTVSITILYRYLDIDPQVGYIYDAWLVFVDRSYRIYWL